jgi:DNA polymerase-3 subunit delta'
MNQESANAFLKTLEEPPPGNIFILNVTESRDLLPTILSRCQTIPFCPLSAEAIAAWLQKEKGMGGEDALVLAKLSEGSLGRSVDLHDRGFLEVRRDHLLTLIGLPQLSPVQNLQTALEYSGKGKKKGSEATDKRGGGLFELLSVWKTWYRDLILVKVNGPKDLLINVDFSQKLMNIAKIQNIESAIDSFFVIDAAQRDLLENRNVDLLMENTVLSLMGLANRSSVKK